MEENTMDLRSAKGVFSRIGLALSAILAVGTVIQLLLAFFLRTILGPGNPVLREHWLLWLLNFVPLYAMAFPVGFLILGKASVEPYEKQKLGAGNGWVAFMISVFVMYVGSIVGNTLSMVLSGGEAVNQVAEMAMDNHPLKVLFMVILAPLLEELLFRRAVIDRIRCYGEKTALLLSSLTFGLMHQNLFQFFYAFGVGMILGYLYLRTGRLRYSVILHAIINFMGSVLAPFILSLVDLQMLESIDPTLSPEALLPIYLEILPGMLVMLAYVFILLGLFIAGLVLFIIRVRKLQWKQSASPLPAGTVFRTAYLNFGMILFGLICGALMVFNLL